MITNDKIRMISMWLYKTKASDKRKIASHIQLDCIILWKYTLSDIKSTEEES